MKKRLYFLYLLFGLFIMANDSLAEERITYISLEEDVFLAPLADAGDDTTICLGDSIVIGGTLTGPPGSTYQWSNSASLSNENVANPKASPQITTTYTVTVTDGTSATATDQITITISSIPKELAGIDRPICTGASVELGDTNNTVYPNYTYQWSNGSSLNFDTVSHPMATPDSATKYFVTVTNQAGCSKVDSISITLKKLPRIDAGADRIMCNGGSTNLGGLPTAPFYSTYVWDNASTLSDEFLSNPIASPTVTTVYTVTATHSGVIKCSNTGQVTLYVNSLPPINAGVDTTICAGTSITLGGSPTVPLKGANYNWSQGSSLNNKTISNPVATPLTNKIYKVTVTDGLTSCTLTDQVTVNIDTVPTADAGLDIGLCLGGSTVLGGNSAGVTYSWDNGSSLNDTSLANPTSTPDSATTYTLTVTSFESCTATDQVTVFVDTLPAVDAGMDMRICEGNSTVIGGANSGTPSFKYAWDNSSSLDYDTILNPEATPSVTTNYTLTVTNGFACSATDQMTVTVDPYPITNAGSDRNICLGTSTQLGGNPTTSSANSVEWSPSTGLSSTTSLNPTATPLVNTTYTLVVTDAVTLCTDTDIVVINVDTVPSADAGLDQTICEGDTVSIGSSIVPGLEYKWNNAASLNFDTLASPIAFPKDTTTYILIMGNSFSCHDTDEVVVNVNPLPIVNAGLDRAICFSDTINLGGNPTSSGLGDNYLWSNNVGLANRFIANPKVFPSDSTKYYLTVTSAFGCISSDSVAIPVNVKPDVDFSFISLCEGTSTDFQDNSTITEGSLLLWYWEFGDGIGTSNSRDPSYNYLSDGSFDVKVKVTSQEACVDSMVKNITILPKPDADAGIDQEICFDDQIQLGGNPTSAAGSAYNWVPSSSLSSGIVPNPLSSLITTTEYKLTVSDQNGCENYDTVQIKVNPLPIVSASNDLSLCVNQPIQLNSSGANTYSWSPGIWLDNSSISTPITSPLKDIIYVVTGTDVNGCVDTDTVNIEVFNVDFSTADTSICHGTDAVLSPKIEGDVSGITYKWTPSSSLTNDNVKNPVASPKLDQLYKLRITNSNGCEDTDSIRVSIRPRAGLEFEFVNSVLCVGATIDVTNKTANSNQFEWFLNYNFISSATNPSFEIDNSIDNTLTLFGYVNGCKDSLEKVIPLADFIKYLNFDKPNVFTPNGDGINDEFDPIFQLRGRPLGCIDFKIYQVFNRWGRLVFETKQEDKVWNGANMGGADSKEGTYFYIVRIGANEFKGTVYLSR